MNEKETQLNKKHTIRIDNEDYSLLKGLVKKHGTMENALKKVIDYFRNRRNKNGKIVKTSST
jgi:hypothetical protein